MKIEQIAQEISVLMPIIARRVLLGFFRDVDISQPQLFTLMAINELETCRLSQLVTIMQVKAPTVTGLVDRLEQNGLARRKPDTADRRVINVRLTPKGTRLAVKFRRAIKARWQEILQEIPSQDAKQLIQILRKIKGVI